MNKAKALIALGVIVVVAAASGAQQGLPEPQLHPEAPTVCCRWCGCLGCSWNPQAVASH